MKKIVTLTLVLSMLLVLSPMAVSAEEGYVDAGVVESVHEHSFEDGGDESVVSTLAAGLCHCGAPRGEQQLLAVSEAPCSDHENCTVVTTWPRTYSYCTNPSCGDNWYKDYLDQKSISHFSK